MTTAHEDVLWTIPVGGVPFVSLGPSDAAEWAVREARRGSTSVRLANAYCVAIAARDDSYGALLRGPGVNFPDGSPVSWAMRLRPKSGYPRPSRVRGPSFFLDVMRAGVASGLTHYFLGSTAPTLEAMIARLGRTVPGLSVAGTYAPDFGPVDERFLADAAARISASGADIVWIGMGTPKQDFASVLLAERTGRMCVGVGAAFDFAAGTVREAPPWIQSFGLEWLFRLATEPGRLWRRYLIGNWQFALTAIRGLPATITSAPCKAEVRKR